MKSSFSKEQIIDKIRFENLWWDNQQIESYFMNMRPREYFKLFQQLVTEKSIRRAVVLMGPRRVGKTVMIFHSIQNLIEEEVDPKKICYLSIDNPIYNGMGLEELLQLVLETTKNKRGDELYVYFDEIQYLKNWEIHLKTLVDAYHQIKFIVSGSAAAALKLKSDESGAGRFTDFVLPPLTFHEYILLKDLDSLIEIDTTSNIFSKQKYSTNNIQELNRHFIDYINYGGYPEVSLSETIQANYGRYMKNDIIDKVLLRDLPSLYGIQDIQELNSLFTYIAYNSGNEVSLDGLASNSGVAKNTIKKYITYLEAAFLIKVVSKIDQSAKKFTRATFYKIYLTNPSLRSALFSPIKADDPFIGNMVETAIYSQWQHSSVDLYYARWKTGEVDIVCLNSQQKPSWIVEVKWTNKFFDKPYELSNINKFCKEHKMKDIVRITTIDKKGIQIIDGEEYLFVPASLYCYTVGRNLVEGKRIKLVGE